MDQVTKSINSFLGMIVGGGLICMFAFVFLLASARLSNSRLVDLLAKSAGETAHMARTESFSFWGEVGSEVSNGLGLPEGAKLFSIGTAQPGPTTQPIVVVPTTQPLPTAGPTVVPAAYIRSSPYSEMALRLWRGLDEAGQLMPLGADLQTVRDSVTFALRQNAGDLLALWLDKKLKACQVYRDELRAIDLKDKNSIQLNAMAMVNECNPRAGEAYAYARWAELMAWKSQDQLDTTRAPEMLAGLQINVAYKLDGAARGMAPTDNVLVILNPPGFDLPGANMSFKVSTLNQLLGAGKWTLNSGPYTVPGTLLLANLPEPALPTEAELTPPVTAVTPESVPAATAAQPGAAAQPPPPSGKYVVQSGDTAYSIATKFNITFDELVNANYEALAFNPNHIEPGQELVIPTPTP